MMGTTDQLQARTIRPRDTSINQVVEISTEKGVMVITTEGQTLKTVTKVLGREPTRTSIPSIKMAPNLPSGMHNFKLMVLMARQCWKH